MGKKGYFISLILLVLFGVNLLAEAASNHAEPINHSVSIQGPELKAALHSTTDCPDADHPLDNSNECGDPCHTGRCHFGHCYHMVKGYSALDPSIALYGHVTYELLVPKSPFLEGPKRPPRHS
jgi:hypothetical protein